MPRPNCPSADTLLQFGTVPEEMAWVEKTTMRFHLRRCGDCAGQLRAIQLKWQAAFQPEPDLNDSLLRVFSKLQHDETLILKGWKLSNPPEPVATWSRAWTYGSGAIAASVVAALIILAAPAERAEVSVTETEFSNAKPPLAQIISEDKNRVNVDYVEPVLLESMEFATSAR